MGNYPYKNIGYFPKTWKSAIFCRSYRYNKKLLNKKNVFKEETKTKKSIYITMITSCGLIDNSYAKDIANSVNVEEELFI